jgi:GDP-L-fucose synthase
LPATANTTYPLAGRSVWVCGHRGMVGSALVRRLAGTGAEVVVADRDRVDLRRQADVEGFMEEARPQAVFLAAAKVGGIHANSAYPADFLHDNLAIQLNVVEAARRVGVEKLMVLGSSCIYPREAPQPIPEEALLTGPLEPTNEWYAVAKIAGIKLAQAYRRQHGCDFISAMPTNLYGPNDNFDPENSHVVPALIRRFHEAAEAGTPRVVVWGSGRPRREFMHVDDLADACVHLMETYSGGEHVNVGTGSDVTIADLARTVARVAGYRGEIVQDASRPDGMPRKLLDASRLARLGWTARIPLEDGLRSTYDWYLANRDAIRG